MPRQRARQHSALRTALAAAVLLAPAGLAAQDPVPPQAAEMTFRVTADPAVVRLGPDAASPAIDAFAKGALVKAYAAEGAWIRFAIARRDGSVVLGYVAAADLELAEGRERAEAGFWVVEEEAYHGRGINFRLTGALGNIGSGDLVDGGETRYLDSLAWFLARDYTMVEEQSVSFATRSGFGIDMTYNLTPRFGLGLGMTVSWSRDMPDSRFERSPATLQARASSELNLLAMDYRLIASYLVPLGKLLSFRVYGGPLLAHLRFFYHGMVNGFEEQQNFRQTVRGQGLGAHAGAALELNLNENVAIFLEAAGRTARVSGFEGTEDDELIIDKSSDTLSTSGTLYAVDVDGRTILMVLEDPALAPGPYRKASFSLLGADAKIGVKIRF